MAETLAAKLGVSIDLSSVADKEPMIAYVHENLCIGCTKCFDTGVWNLALINELLFRRFGVSYHPRYLCSLLNKLGLSYQKAGFITDRTGEEAYEQQRRAWLSHQGGDPVW